MCRSTVYGGRPLWLSSSAVLIHERGADDAEPVLLARRLLIELRVQAVCVGVRLVRALFATEIPLGVATGPTTLVVVRIVFRLEAGRLEDPLAEVGLVRFAFLGDEAKDRMARQPGFFDIDERVRRLSDLGDQFTAYGNAVDVKLFGPELGAALSYADGSKGGRPPFDPVMMARVLAIQAENTLFDERAGFLIN